MKKVYLDSSVLISLVFGQKAEPKRYKLLKGFFSNKKVAKTCRFSISLYTLQECLLFCQQNFGPEKDAAFALLLKQILSLPCFSFLPLIPREIKILLSPHITVADPSDLNHVLTAINAECNTIFAYDFHLIKAVVPIACQTPEEFLKSIS